MSGKMENERIWDKIIGMYSEFISEVDPKNVLDLLIQKDIITNEEKDDMMKKLAREDRCRTLLDLLISSSQENSFITLKEALEEHYPWIVQRIDTLDVHYQNVNNPFIEDSSGNDLMHSERHGKPGQSSSKKSSTGKKNLDPTKSGIGHSRVNETKLEAQLKEANRKIDILTQKLEQTMKDTAELRERMRILEEFQTPDGEAISKKESDKNGNAGKPEIPGKVVSISWRNLFIPKTKIKNPKDQPAKSSSAYEKLKLPDGNSSDGEPAKEFESYAVVIGEYDGLTYSNDVIKINLNQPENISNLQRVPTPVCSDTAAAVYCNSIFVAGLGSKCDKIWRFDATSSKWEYCTSMVQGRGGHSVAFVDHILYICGGWIDSEERIFDDVEAYDAINNKCISAGKLVHAVKNSGNCVPFRASLYIFGGYNVYDKVIGNDVQVYDSKSNTCSLLSKPMPKARGCLRAALWENSVILLGSLTCLIYDFEKETWKERDQYKTDAGHFGVIIDRGKIFVIGGCRGTRNADQNIEWTYLDDVRYVPVVNVLNDIPIEWTHHGKLPNPSAVSAFGKIELSVQNTRQSKS